MSVDLTAQSTGQIEVACYFVLCEQHVLFLHYLINIHLIIIAEAAELRKG